MARAMGRFELWRARVFEQRLPIALGALVAAVGPAVLAAPADAHLSPECSRSGPNVSCYYTSGANPVKIPAGVRTVEVDAVGGMGATSGPGADEGGIGGMGDQVSGSLPVTGPTTLWAVVGGNASGANGGANGGGDGAVGGVLGGGGGGGGGASDVRTSESDLASRLLVAAGGGGGGAPGRVEGTFVPGLEGGNGGNAGVPGGDGTDPGAGGGAGTSTRGGLFGSNASGCAGAMAGALGAGGAGGTATGCGTGGGGGGGLYGGGGGQGGAMGTIILPPPHPVQFVSGSGGGGGGSDLVPAGGSSSVDTTGQPFVRITFRHGAHPR